jgi:integrase
MRGYITKRAKDSYTIVLELGRDPETGKRKQQWISIKGTKKEAEKRLTELLTQVENGIYIKSNKSTLAEYLKIWLKDYAWPNLSPKTAEGYEYIIESHLIPSLGKLTLTQIKPEHLQRYYAEKLSSGRIDGKGGLSPKTVRHHHITLHGALQSAVKWGLLARNPADAVDAPRFQRPEMNIMNADEINTFLEAAKDTPFYALFYLALFTGMRRSELLALRWTDINLMLCQLYVSRSLHQLKNGGIIYRQPKSDKSRRMISLTPSTAIILREHKEHQNSEKLLQGLPVSDDDLVFSQPDRSPYRPDTITHAWIKLARKTGLKDIRLHDARHTHASLMLKQGIHPKIVQERLGHSSIQITLDTYSHVAPGLQEAAAKRFDDIIHQKSSIKIPNT